MGLRRLELLVQERCRPGTLTFQEALQLFHRLLAAKNRAPPILLFNKLFTAFVRMKNSNNYYATIFSLFDCLTETPRFARSLPDVFTYTILMGYCTQMNQPTLGFIYFGRFIKAGLRADAFICNALLKALCSENRIHDAVNLMLNKMHKLACIPNVVPYSIIIDALCKKGEINKAFRLLDQMLLEGLVPDVIIYSSLILGLHVRGEIRRAEEVMQQMVSRGRHPDVVTYGTLINGLCKNGEIEKAEELLHVMSSQGFQPNVVTYTTLIDGFCKKGLLDKAVEKLQCMVSTGIKPDVVTYCKQGRTKDAVKLFDLMVRKGVKPDVVSYGILLLGKVNEAMCVLSRMKQEGVKPDFAASSPLVELLLNMGRVDDAKDLMDWTSTENDD
ncbi:hypothetical protein LUZ63_012906 [Rhynchospora breviuscula]|uniref:Pentatricopeptide repeat-containing protein n=1 Tax=Rhynchospora breviuscula TaxID=2022672 RepID=A0A9Q0HJP3_9POAL|nr:hypothetical protein LUZ63_012906 [Rhynchospora breviuscula]